MTTNEYAHILRFQIDYNRYASLCQSLGKSLNDKKDRFDKADLIEKSVETFSNGRMVWIDLEGHDFFDREIKAPVEFKFVEDGILSNIGKFRRKHTSVVIKNLRTIPDVIDIPEKSRAEYYIVAQQDAMIVLSWKEIEPLLQLSGTKIIAKIPADSGHFIFTPMDLNDVRIEPIDYRAEKLTMQDEIIGRF